MGKKQSIRWPDVSAGDIISFKYKSQAGRTRIHTVLVLNPRIPIAFSNKRGRYLIGIKLESNNKPQVILGGKILNVLERIGKFTPIDKVNKIFKLEIDDRFIINAIKGVKKPVFDKLKADKNLIENYRTYDYKKCKRVSVYLEPIKVLTEIKMTVDGEGKNTMQNHKPGDVWNEDGVNVGMNPDGEVAGFVNSEHAKYWAAGKMDILTAIATKQLEDSVKLQLKNRR